MTTAARGSASVTPERTADGQIHASGGLVAEIRDLHVDLTRNNTTLKVLRGIDLDIRKGEILGLVGESGSGKSVLGLTLLGLLPIASDPQTSGSATVAGVDMLTGSAEVRRIGRQAHLGAVFQDPMTSLNPTMRVGRQVAEAAGSGTEALKLLTAVGIPDAGRRMSSYPHELSGGLRQRVMIAMAVAGNPDLVIADEPTTALDVTVQAQVLTLLARLRDELGCSVLMITHDLGVAAQVADRIAVLYAGRLAEVGPTAAVLRDPAHPYPAGLLASRLSLNTDRTRPIRVLAGSLPDPAKPLSGCAYAPRCALRMPECDTAPPELTPVPIAIVVVDSRADAVGGGADAVGSPAGGMGGRAGQPQHLHACLADVSAVRTLRAALDGSSRLDGSSTRDGSSIEGNGTGRAGSDAVVPDAVVPDGVVPDAVALDAVGPDGVGPDRVGPDGVALDASGPAVRIAKVTKTYRVKAGRGRKVPLHALRGVSLTVGQGEAVAIVGESGSGKTTLLRVVAGLERPDQATGAVRVGSGPRSQMVFQDAGASLTPWLTVGSLLEERLRSEGIPRSERRSRAVQALRHVGLPPETAEARAAELSGGQRQRVALARAIVVPPRLLLCDEPTSALDVSLAASVLNLIQTLRRELSMAVIFVTHDVSVARVIADRIAVMYLGRIVELGSAEELTTHPKHPYTKNLLAAVPDFGAAPPPMAGEPASALNPPTGCGFHPRCGFAQPACGDPQLDVPLVKLTVGAESLTDAADRRVACIRPEVI